MRHGVLVLVTAIVLAACGAGEQPAPESTTALVPDTSTTTSAAGAETTGSTVARGESEQAPTTAATTAPKTEEDLMTGPVPENMMTGIIADLMERTGATQSQLTLVRAESAIWNDGSLGCPLPGQSYTQALVNGYWVVLAYAGSEYDYRASSSSFRLCEGGGSPPSNPTG